MAKRPSDEDPPGTITTLLVGGVMILVALGFLFEVFPRPRRLARTGDLIVWISIAILLVGGLVGAALRSLFKRPPKE